MTWLTEDWIEGNPLSSNFSDRPDGEEIDAIVLHYTAGGDYIKSSWEWFNDPAAQGSAHFIVGREGQIVQCVPITKKAWHAGRSHMMRNAELVADVNKFSIGIEIANFGLLIKDGDEFYVERGRRLKRYKREKYGEPIYGKLIFDDGKTVEGYWEPYGDAQRKAVVKLCALLVKEFNIVPERIVGHEDIAMPLGRKTDPGPAWPWVLFGEELAEELGGYMWVADLDAPHGRTRNGS